MNGEKEDHLASLVNQIKTKNIDVMQYGKEACENVALYFQELRNVLSVCETQVRQKFDKELLNYHEQSAQLATFLSHKTVIEEGNEQ